MTFAATSKCAGCGAALDNEAPGEERKPCPNCGSTARAHEGKATLDIGAVSMSVEGKATRGLNEVRLAVLGIIVTIGLTVGFGVQGAWWVRASAGAGAFLLTVAVISWPPSRRFLMQLMHRITGR